MLSRSTQIGEYYIMSPPRFKVDFGTTHACDLTIYDEEKDDFVTITWRDAAIATGCFAVDDFGTGFPAVQGTIHKANPTLIDINAGGTTRKLNEWTDRIKGWYSWCHPPGGTPPAAPDYTSRPCIVLARPFIEHLVRAPASAHAHLSADASSASPPLPSRPHVDRCIR